MKPCKLCKQPREENHLFLSKHEKGYICKDGSKCKTKERKKGGAFNKDMEKEVSGRRWNGAETKE